MVLPPGATKHLLDYSFSSQMPKLLAALGISGALVYLNRTFYFKPVVTMTPEWQAESAKFGKGVAACVEGPPVFLNPIRTNVPGNVLGPEDLAHH